MRVIEATYKNSDYFHIPSEIKLLTIEDNNKVKRNEKIAWSWHIRWGTLFYLDADLKEQEIDACNKASESDNIVPDEYHEQEEDDEICWKEDDCPACEEEEDDEELDWNKDYNVWLALNYGFSIFDGRHAKTSNEHWDMFKTWDKTPASHEKFWKAMNMLNKEQLEILDELNDK
jgi:hypothetical protein